jgi:hypothetical protein
MIFSHMRRAFHLLVLTSLLILPSTQSARAAGNVTILVSIDSQGALGDSGFDAPSISANGRYIAFTSFADNLVPGDSNNVSDIFVHDTQTGVTTIVSVSSAEVLANEASSRPAISADGRYVAFESLATNLAGQDKNPFADIFVRDLQAGTTTLVSVSSSEQQAADLAENPSISADGRYVTFDTLSPLTSGDVNGDDDVFVRDIIAGTTRLVSVSSSGVQGDSFSHFGSISPDGRYVAFRSNATNLVDGDSNNTSDIFLRDLQTGTTVRVSVTSDEVEANSVSGYPAVSSNGHYVVFDSWASNLVYGDTNNVPDIFVRDTVAGTTSRLSVSSDGVQGADQSGAAKISSDGRYVTFTSWAENLVTGDTNTYPDVFVRDTTAGTTWRVSVDSNGLQGNYGSWSSDISPDGGYVAFVSWAQNLVATPIDHGPQVFSHGPYINASFADVPPSHPYFQDIEILFANGLTAGCSTSPLKYCPDQIMNRAESAVFMLRGNFGSSYIPSVPTHIFQDDWSKGAWAESWADAMWTEGLSGGCQTNPPKYCPWNQIPREQAVIFALRMKYGISFTPPPATGTVLADMTNPSYYATAWAEQAYKDGLIPSCGMSGNKPLFCPKNLVSRGLAAYIIVRAKNLTMP